MCGRYSVGPSVVKFAQEFDPSFQGNGLPVYNASPGRQLPLVLDRTSHQIEMYTWGFTPAWVKEDTHQLLINARCESVEVKSSFKDCFRDQRCLVLSDGYYEWKKTTQGKQPYHISLRHIESFAMAGLWQRRSDGEGRFCIITTTAADSIHTIHDRMPVILPPYQYDLWLSDTHDIGALKSLLQPCPDEELQATMVSKRVNSVRNDDPTLVEPLGESA